MSTPVGSHNGFVDTQDVQIENVTDALIYTQAQTMLPFKITHDMVEHHTCTGYVEKLASLESVSVPIVVVLTEPELAALMTLSLLVNQQLPIKTWTVTFTSFNNLGATISGKAKMFDFEIADAGLDVVTVKFRLEFESDVAGLTVPVVAVT